MRSATASVHSVHNVKNLKYFETQVNEKHFETFLFNYFLGRLSYPEMTAECTAGHLVHYAAVDMFVLS